MNERKLACDILTKVENSRAYANLELSGVLNEDSLKNAFVSALVYGVLERKLTLDYIISKYSSKRVRDIDIAVRNMIRIALYQILYMDKVPTHSAVDESVELAKAIGGKKQAGFVNAVLRAALSDKNISKISIKDELTGISKAYSVDRDLVSLLCNQYGINGTKAYLKTTFGRPPVTIRVNTEKCDIKALIQEFDIHGVNYSLNEAVENALDISDFGQITELEAFKNGMFHVQDAASQICAKALGAKSKERIIDLCAAPGGKTFTVAQYMKNEGEVLSCDIHSHRVKLIEDGANRLGLTNVRAILNDASVFNENLGTFNKVLCDVPCSGTGVIRRKPEIRYKKLSDIEQLVPLQKQILKTSSKYVKSGGVLLYSTCSVLDMENGAVTKEFLKENSDFLPAPLFEGDKAYEKTFLPNIDNTDGFYICKFIKK